MELNRRQFMVAVIGSAAACGCSSSGTGTTPAMPPAKLIDVGAPPDFVSDGVDDRLARTEKVLIVREGNKLYALSAICTHRACILKKADDAPIKCPCHGSWFSMQGVPQRGPAKGALPRFAIAVNEGGRVIVDTSQRFDSGQSDDPRTFVLLG